MRNKARLHPLDVDESNVMKKAETNARARCLMGLGLADFTPSELDRADFDTTKSTSHDYKKQSPKSTPTDKQLDLLKGMISKKMDGSPGTDAVMDWILEDKKFDKKQCSNLINWFFQYQDGAMDYNEEFQTKFNDAVAGKYFKEDKK